MNSHRQYLNRITSLDFSNFFSRLEKREAISNTIQLGAFYFLQFVQV